MIDRHLLSTRRRALGLSQRALASRLGINAVTVRRLEDGENHEELTLRTLGRLADTLGVEPAQLLRTDEPQPANGDAASDGTDDRYEILVAALLDADTLVAQADLATLCQCTLREVQQVLKALDLTLRPSGIRVHRTPQGGYGLRPIRELTAEESGPLERRKLGRRGLTTTHGRLLRAALNRPLNRHFGNADSVAVATLQRAGLLADTEDGLTLSDEVRFSLLLTET